MKKYRLEFEDQEYDLSVPVIVHTTGDDFWDAIDQVRDEIDLADRAKDEGCPVYEEIKRRSREGQRWLAKPVSSPCRK